MLKYLGGTIIALSIFFILGVAGADCDGKCMENSLSISDILLYTFYGICGIIIGSVMLMKGDENV